MRTQQTKMSMVGTSERQCDAPYQGLSSDMTREHTSFHDIIKIFRR